jgi:Glycoside hydrolase 123, catalytic domain/Glycoside hydrolase 123 N-terminal domain
MKKSKVNACYAISSLLFLLSAAMTVRQAAAEVEIWPAPAEAKVTMLQEEFDKDSYIWKSSDPTVRLAAAGGEHAFFQVVAAVKEDTLEDVTVSMLPLQGPGGPLPASAVRVYFCPLVKVYAPSTENGKAGWYPDPLVKLTNPVVIRPNRHQKRYNQTFWIEIEVPRGQRIGSYRGRVKLSAAGVEQAAFDVELRVRGFDLPEVPHYYAMFNTNRGWLSSYYDKERLAGKSLDQMLAIYFDFMLDRGIQPWFNPLIQPEQTPATGGGIEINWPNKKWEEHFLSHPAYKRVTFPAAPPGLGHGYEGEKFGIEFNKNVRDWVGGILEHYKKNGWQDKLTFFGPVDEPNSLEAYEELIRWGKLVKSVDPSISFQVTEQPLPSNSDWPSLTQVASDWVIHGKALESNREEILRQLALGNNASWYISCDQTGTMANYFIDEPGVDARAVAWITYNYGLEGMLYWATNFWREVKDPWSDVVTWKRSSCNAPLAGEGSLVYPGESIRRFCRQENVVGPVSSIRLELLRKGIEEIEYLHMLSAQGKSEEAMKLCMELVISADTFTRDPGRFKKVKAKAAALLVK